MSIISRSEAVYQLKRISSQVNNAISGVREGLWSAGLDAAIEAREDLDRMIAHLEEAAQASPEAQAAASRPIGGMGYRGSSGSGSANRVCQSYTTSYPAPQRPIVEEPPKVDSTPPAPLNRTVKTPAKGSVRPPRPIITVPPIVTPPPAPPKPPIVTPPPPPPPPVYEPATVSIFPTEYDGIPPLTFDFKRMLDQSDRDPEIVRMHQLFLDLPENDRKALLAQYNKTNKPVTCKIRTQ